MPSREAGLIAFVAASSDRRITTRILDTPHGVCNTIVVALQLWPCKSTSNSVPFFVYEKGEKIGDAMEQHRTLHAFLLRPQSNLVILNAFFFNGEPFLFLCSFLLNGPCILKLTIVPVDTPQWYQHFYFV